MKCSPKFSLSAVNICWSFKKDPILRTHSFSLRSASFKLVNSEWIVLNNLVQPEQMGRFWWISFSKLEFGLQMPNTTHTFFTSVDFRFPTWDISYRLEQRAQFLDKTLISAVVLIFAKGSQLAALWIIGFARSLLTLLEQEYVFWIGGVAKISSSMGSILISGINRGSRGSSLIFNSSILPKLFC